MLKSNRDNTTKSHGDKILTETCNNDEALFKYQEVWKWCLRIYGILFIFREIDI